MDIKASHIVLGVLGVGAAYLVYREVTKPAAAAPGSLPKPELPATNKPMMQVIASVGPERRSLDIRRGQRIQVVSPSGKWTSVSSSNPGLVVPVQGSADVFTTTEYYGTATIQGTFTDANGAPATASIDLTVTDTAPLP